MNLRSFKVIALGTLAGLAIVAGVAVAAFSVGAEDEPDFVPVDDVSESAAVTTQALSMDAATQLAQAAQDAAAERDAHITVAVVDRGGNTLALIKGDGTGAHSVDTATAKAYTAASLGRSTREIAENYGGDSPGPVDIPGVILIAGGVTVAVDDVPIAGIGVSGLPDPLLDEEIALEALEAIK
ncbi:MAG: GlcG/HbpS family heme-binding protein [Stackebrandtia sp.]